LELLDTLKQTHALACLSNTNVVHWDRLTSRYGLRERFERCYVSHEIGLSKPDPRIFAHVAEDLGTQPHRITFFDDNTNIIAAANAFGFNAHQVNSPADIRAVLS
jgi:putative hydrolase of the HAD superfamily